MGLSKNWNMVDNVYSQSRTSYKVIPNYNDGVLGLFEGKHDGKVNKCIFDYVNNHSMSESLRLNNSLFFGVINPKDVHKKQYETNRNYILNYFKS